MSGESKDVWPEDENHRIGPNGEKLIAVSSNDVCDGCFGVTRWSQAKLDVQALVFCGDEKKPCSANFRKDGRYIKWVSTGDNK